MFGWNSLRWDDFINILQTMNKDLFSKTRDLEIKLRKLNDTEAVDRKYSIKKLFLKISKNSQENPCARVSVLIQLQTWVFWCFQGV